MKGFIWLLNIVLLLSLLVAGCKPAQTPTRVVETVVVEKQVPVEKEVVKTVVVEKEVVITPMPSPVAPTPTEEPVDLTDFEWDFTPEQDATLTIGLGVDPWGVSDGYLDPHRAFWGEAVWILDQCLSAPLNDTGIEILPDAAVSWEVNETYKEYTLHFNPKRIWSDGMPVVARHFRAGMLRTLSPDVESRYAPLLFGIVGARAYHEGQLGPEDVGLDVLDDTTLRICLEEPDSDFRRVLTTPAAWPTREDFDYNEVAVGYLPSLPCNGYYAFDEYVPGESVTLRRLDSQLGGDQVTVRQARFLFLWDEDPRLRAFEYGELDIAWLDFYHPNAPEAFPWVAYNLQADPGQLLWSLLFNTRSGWCADPAVRQALAMATPPEVAEQVLDVGAVFTAYSLVPDIPGSAVRFDPESARDLLHEAGYDGQTLTILAPDFHRVVDVLNEIAATWDVLLGVGVERVAVPYDEYVSAAGQCATAPRECPYDMVLWWIWPAAAEDPRDDAMLRLFASDCLEPLAGGWTNDKFDELLAQARASWPGDERKHTLDLAQNLLLAKDPALIPLYYEPLHYAWDPDLVHMPIAVPDDPQPKRRVPLKDLLKLKGLSLEDLADLGEELLVERRHYQTEQITLYELRASVAILRLMGWAAKVKPDWKPTTETVKDVAVLLSSLSGKASGATAVADFIYKRISDGKEAKLQKDLDKALDKLLEEVEAAAETARDGLPNQQSDDLKKLKDLVRKKARKDLKEMITGLTTASRARVARGVGGRGWVVIRGTATAPGSKVIQGEFLYKLDKMLKGDLWREHTDYPFWGKWNSPPPPANYRGYYWQSTKHKAIAKRLQELKYFRDTRKPRLVKTWVRARTFAKFFVTDYESGVWEVEIDWSKSINVKEVQWRSWSDSPYNWTKVERRENNISKIRNKTKAGLAEPTLGLRITRKVHGQPSILSIKVRDRDGNEASFSSKG